MRRGRLVGSAPDRDTAAGHPPVRVNGFSLLEMMVALAILVLVFIGLLQLLDSSTRVSKTEAALAEVQENVRFALHHIRHVAAMAGGGGLPLVNDSGWVAVALESNVQGSFVDDFGAAHRVLVGSDVLTLRGFFERPPYLVDPDLDLSSAVGPDVVLDANGGTIRVRSRMGDRVQELERPAVGGGIVLMGQGRYAVAEIEDAALETVDLPDGGPQGGTHRARVLTAVFRGGRDPWDAFNPGGAGYRRPTFQVSRVAALDSYTFFVDQGLRLMRVRGRSSAASVIEPVAVNIAGVQAALGADGDGDGVVDGWFATPDPDVLAGREVRALRVTVLGRTTFPVEGWQEPAETFIAEDMEPPEPVAGPALGPLNARWRRLQSTALLRNLVSAY